MALAGAGCFRTARLTQHALTNIEVIRQFLPLRIAVESEPDDRALDTIS